MNLDTRGDGFDGADFGFIMDASLAPVIILNKPDGTNLFKFGGQDSGLEATATLYFVSDMGCYPSHRKRNHIVNRPWALHIQQPMATQVQALSFPLRYIFIYKAVYVMLTSDPQISLDVSHPKRP